MLTKMKIVALICFSIAIVPSLSSAQDVIIRVQGLYNEAGVALSTICIENLSNNTSVSIADLPTNTTIYEINLSQGGTINSVPTNESNNTHAFVSQTIDNRIFINLYTPDGGEFSFDVYTIDGKKIQNSEEFCSPGFNNFLLKINSWGIFILRISSDNYSQGFKITGAGNGNDVSLLTRASTVQTRQPSVITKDTRSEFVFNQGDTIRINIAKAGYHSNFAEASPLPDDFYQIYLSCPCSESPTLADFDGNVYNTVQIGDQCWMKENLKTTHYANGSAIAEGSTAYPGNNSELKSIYGLLYSATAIMNGSAGSDSNPSGVQGACPDGWHVPSDEEWMQLERYLGMDSLEATYAGEYIFRGDDQGGQLKEPGTSHWNAATTCNNNRSGFTALASGINSWLLGICASWWACATVGNPQEIFFFRKIDNTCQINKMFDSQSFRSVRCIKD